MVEAISSKVVVEFTLEERDILATYLNHEMSSEGMTDSVYEVLKELGHVLAPGWC